MSESKLYELTSEEFRLPFHVDRSFSPITQNAHNIPMIHWPDGRWCVEANLFMLDLYSKSRSRRYKGGTLKTYTANISHLIRFCYKNGIDLHQLTDNWFTAFINGRKKVAQNQSDSSNTVISVGRNCLQFLEVVGCFHNIDKFVSKNGRIRAEKIIITIRTSSGSDIKIPSWHHPSFPTPDPEKKRNPINNKNVDKLKNAAILASKNVFLRKRRLMMIKLLEITGGRRSEVSQLTVQSVMNASKMEDPMIEMTTSKKKNPNTTRLIPVSHVDLKILLDYIQTTRALNIKRIIKKMSLKGIHFNDSGILLINTKTGKGLTPNSFTSEIDKLRRFSKIEEPASPHMFRHRFITKLFVALIEQHNLENDNGIRDLLLASEELKTKILEWTGHKTIKSLDVYISLAFDELTDFKKVYNLVHASRSIDALRSNVKDLKNQIRAGMATAEALQTLEGLLDTIELDLSGTRMASDTSTLQDKL